LGDSGIGGKNTFKYNLSEWGLSVWSAFIWLRPESVTGLLYGSRKSREFLEQTTRLSRNTPLHGKNSSDITSGIYSENIFCSGFWDRLAFALDYSMLKFDT
jgi:hypothetical protein